MSVGNPKKLDLAKKLTAVASKNENSQVPKEDVTRVYKDKNHRIKRELSFRTKKDKPKLT